MNSLANNYFNLLKEDKQYLEKYNLSIENDEIENKCINDYSLKTEEETKMNDQEIDLNIINMMHKNMEKCFEWRKIQNVNEIQEMINKKNIKKLLGIEEYYMDILTELIEGKYKLINVNKMDDDKVFEYYSKNNLIDLANKKDTPQELKEGIKIYLKATELCSELINLKN